MVHYVSLTPHAGYIEQDDRFLCPKIGVIHGSSGTFYFDCGTSRKQLDVIDALRKEGEFKNPSYLGISHFHADHIANFPYFASCKTYGSSNTAKYVRIDQIVDARMEVDLGDAKAILLPIISSHSKGSTILLSDDGVCFVGDALYDNVNQGGYNRSALFETIKTIEGIDAISIVSGHNAPYGETKEGVLAFLRNELKKLAL